MPVDFSVPAKAYQGGKVEIDGEWNFNTLMVKPDVTVTLWVDGYEVGSRKYDNVKRGTFSWEVQAPKAPATSMKIKVAARVTSVTDKGLTHDKSRYVELYAPGPHGAVDYNYAGDVDLKKGSVLGKAPVIAVVVVVIIAVALLAVTKLRRLV